MILWSIYLAGSTIIIKLHFTNYSRSLFMLVINFYISRERPLNSFSLQRNPIMAGEIKGTKTPLGEERKSFLDAIRELVYSRDHGLKN